MSPSDCRSAAPTRSRVRRLLGVLLVDVLLLAAIIVGVAVELGTLTGHLTDALGGPRSGPGAP